MATKTIHTNYGNLTYPEKVGRADGSVVAKLWEAGDKCRVYFTVYFNGGKADCGYFDIALGKSFLKSNPVHIARQIEAELIFQL